MRQQDTENIRHAMLLCQMRLKNLRPHIEHSENLSEIYNRVLIEKAVNRNELSKTRVPLLVKIVNKLFPTKEKRICDYFN